MSRHPRLNRPDRTSWMAEAVRITAFPLPDAVVTADTWWKELLGAEASVETVRKGRLVRQEQGDALGGLLTLTVQPGRIDWNLGGQLPENEPPQDFPSLGRVVESVPKFIDFLTRWTPSTPPIGRLAFGVNAWVPTRDHQEAYGLLDALLPAVEIDPTSTDFQYRINRPRQSRLQIDGLRINRLSSWAALRMELLAVAGGTQPFRAAPLFAVKAELDINTAPDYPGQLPPGSLVDLLSEFVDLGLELLTEGEIP
jgi:hypothetical protein